MQDAAAGRMLAHPLVDAAIVALAVTMRHRQDNGDISDISDISGFIITTNNHSLGTWLRRVLPAPNS